MKHKITEFRSLFMSVIMISVCLTGMEGCSDDSPKVSNDFNSNAEIAAAADELYSDYMERISDRQKELTSGRMKLDAKTIALSTEVIGKPDENGYPLYIALRGGGVEDEAVAREQFEIMREGYTPAIKSGIYVVTQPFEARWDEHYLPEMFAFYDRIIEDAQAFYNVDPNRVYLLGFSSGGDGVYAIAPRMADRFAAVNMSAGFPHTHLLGNMYQLPICIQIGEDDTAYDRNINAARYDQSLKEHALLYGNAGDGFTHDTFIHVNGTHNSWSDVDSSLQKVYTGDEVSVWLTHRNKAKTVDRNTSAVDWINAYTRNPIPERIVWQPSVNAGLRKSQAFYWLDRDADLTDSTVIVSCNRSTNSITVEKCDAACGTLKVYLNPQMLDVFRDVSVNIQGKDITVRPIVSRQIMESTLHARGDKNWIFTSEIDITFNGASAPTVEAVPYHSDSYETQNINHLMYWDDNGLFYVDDSLFGLNRHQLSEKLGMDISQPELREDGKKNLLYAEADVNGSNVVFAFQNNRCMVICSEKEENAFHEPYKTAEKQFGSTDGEFVVGGLCRYYMQTITHDSVRYIWQKYEYYKLSS